MIPEPSDQQKSKLAAITGTTTAITILMLALAIGGLLTGDTLTAITGLILFTLTYPLALLSGLGLGLSKVVEQQKQDNPLMDMVDNMTDMMDAGDEELTAEDFNADEDEEKK